MLQEKLRVACLQYCAGDNLEANLATACRLIDSACDAGAQALFLPEACDFLGKGHMASYAMLQSEHIALEYFCKQSAARQVWLFLGSLSVREESGAVCNRSFVIDPQGRVRAHYDKIHMFDAAVPGHEVSRESDIYRAGDRAVLFHSPWGGIGLSICYDVRFPQLYRSLSQAGADMLTVPAAFTRNSGEAHWHALLRSRAIENGCFVIAAAQCGSPYEGRFSYGHSLIIDPWGKVLAEAGNDPQVITAELDLRAINAARKAIASLDHDRHFSLCRIE